MDAVVNVISTVGFPIFCVLALMYFILKSTTRTNDENKDREERLYSTISKQSDIMKEMSDTNAKFVEIVNELKAKIGEVENDVAEIKTIISTRKDE